MHNLGYVSLPILGAAAWVLMYPGAPFGNTVLLGATFGSVAAATAMFLTREVGPSDFTAHKVLWKDLRQKITDAVGKPEVYAMHEDTLYRVQYGNLYAENVAKTDIEGLHNAHIVWVSGV